MKTWWVCGVLCVGVAGVWLYISNTGVSVPASEAPGEAVAVPQSAPGNPAPAVAAPQAETARTAAQRRAAAAGSSPVNQAMRRVRQAEATLAAMEQELERFELLVADIEARGEDPADYAAEVMPEFQPLMNRFLDAQAELDAASDALAVLEAGAEMSR